MRLILLMDSLRSGQELYAIMSLVVDILFLGETRQTAFESEREREPGGAKQGNPFVIRNNTSLG